MVGYKLFGDVDDAAYGQVVAAVLPQWLSGAFAARPGSGVAGSEVRLDYKSVAITRYQPMERKY